MTQVATLQGQIDDLMMRPTQETVDAQVATLQGQIETLMDAAHAGGRRYTGRDTARPDR